jgi:hypothetical protein
MEAAGEGLGVKRDWNIIRRLLQLVAIDSKIDCCFCREYASILYGHVILLKEGGFAEICQFDDSSLWFAEIVELTDKGRLFIELSQDEGIWAAVMKVADDRGEIHEELLVELLEKGRKEVCQ